MEYAAGRKLVLSFYNIPNDDLPLFRRCGFQVTKWGEEAVISLPEQTWSGKAFEWVRRQSNYCQRQRVSFSECRRETMAAQEWTRLTREMTEIAGTSPADKPQAEELAFMQGSFDPRRLGRKRIFIARSQAGAGRVEGFLVCNPAADGKLWVFEIYRHRTDAVRGTVAFLMQQAMLTLSREGVRAGFVVPGAGIELPRVARRRQPADAPRDGLGNAVF